MKYLKATSLHRLVCLAIVAAFGLATTSAASPRSSGHSAPTKGSAPSKAVPATQPQGVWGAPVELGMISIHMAVLHTGKAPFSGAPRPPARLDAAQLRSFSTPSPEPLLT